MVQNVNPTFVKTPNWGATQITTGTGQNVLVTVYSGGANGSKINGLIAVSIGTTNPFDILWGVSSGGTFFNYGISLIPANAGASDTVPTVNLLSNANIPLPVDSDGNAFVLLPSSAYSLQAKSNSASSQWTASAVMQVIANSVGDF